MCSCGYKTILIPIELFFILLYPCFSLCKEDAEERRKIVEGADALLNLAGITTRRLRKRSSSLECIDAKRECTDTLRQMYLKRQTDNNNEPSTVIIEHHKDKFR